MTVWQLALFVIGAVWIVCVGIVATMSAVWRRQERKDGLR